MIKKDVKKVLVVGAGTMGHSIAQVFAKSGIHVNLVDTNQKILDHALALMALNLNFMAEQGMLAADEVPGILKRVRPSLDLAESAAGADFAIEAVPERPDLKKEVFLRLEQYLPQGAIIASNTSGLDIFSLLEAGDPSRYVVAHWFAPAHIIPLVEVVPGPKTSAEAVQVTVGLMEEIGKTTLVMKQFVPLFIVNRIQKSIAEAVYEILKNDWATPQQIDLAVKMSLGLRLPILGVVQTMDFNGLDTIMALNQRDGIHLPLVEEKVKQGQLGVKTAKGIYDYGGRTEAEIMQKRDGLLFNMMEYFEKNNICDPV